MFSPSLRSITSIDNYLVLLSFPTSRLPLRVAFVADALSPAASGAFPYPPLPIVLVRFWVSGHFCYSTNERRFLSFFSFYFKYIFVLLFLSISNGSVLGHIGRTQTRFLTLSRMSVCFILLPTLPLNSFHGVLEDDHKLQTDITHLSHLLTVFFFWVLPRFACFPPGVLVLGWVCPGLFLNRWLVAALLPVMHRPEDTQE